MSEALTGAELLQKVKDLGDIPKEEKAKACGYVTYTKGNVERVNMMKFLNALLEADGGLGLDGRGKNSMGRGGRSARYRIAVQSNGNLLIGPAYTKKMELEPGDEFEISLGRKHIKLTQVDPDYYDDDDDDDDFEDDE